MSEFQGSGHKVRCIDCSFLSGKQCSAKNAKVAPKKRRNCSSYQFKGEYENRTPLESMYVPYVDKNTRRLLKRLMKMGIAPTTGAPEDSGLILPSEPGQLVFSFTRTATAGVLTMGDVELKNEAAPIPDGEKSEDSVIWTPDNEEE